MGDNTQYQAQGFSEMSILEMPMYSAATVGKFLALEHGRVRRWLQGYNYRYIAGSGEELKTGHKEPVRSPVVIVNGVRTPRFWI